MTQYIPLSGFNYLMQIPIFEMMTVAEVKILMRNKIKQRISSQQPDSLSLNSWILSVTMGLIFASSLSFILYCPGHSDTYNTDPSS